MQVLQPGVSEVQPPNCIVEMQSGETLQVRFVHSELA
jgi:hypothetical protein